MKPKEKELSSFAVLHVLNMQKLWPLGYVYVGKIPMSLLHIYAYTYVLYIYIDMEVWRSEREERDVIILQSQKKKKKEESKCKGI